MRVLAIDPGSEQSALVWCDVTDAGPPTWGILPIGGQEVENRQVVPSVHMCADVLVLEVMATLYASNAAAELLETERWAGEFRGLFRYEHTGGPCRIIEVTSSAARVAVCGTTRAKDADVRRGLVDAYGGDLRAFGRRCPACKGKGWRGRDHGACPDCGEDPGWNPQRGPLHGWTGTHLFRALACAWAAFVPGGPGREVGTVTEG